MGVVKEENNTENETAVNICFICDSSALCWLCLLFVQSTILRQKLQHG